MDSLKEGPPLCIRSTAMTRSNHLLLRFSDHASDQPVPIAYLLIAQELAFGNMEDTHRHETADERVLQSAFQVPC